MSDSLDSVLRLAEEGDWEGAARILRDLLETDPEDAAVLCWLGVAERELGMGTIAYERFRRTIALEPRDPYILATAGSELARMDDPAAESALRTAALLAPDLPLARWSYGAYLAREGYLDQALSELDAAVERGPEEPQAVFERGVARALSGDLDGAVDDFFAAVELDPEDDWARGLLGIALVEARREDEAVSELVRAARDRPDDVDLQLVAALAAGASGREDIAYEMLERARMHAIDGDVPLMLEIEETLDAGPDRARRSLHASLSPSSFHTRLMARP
jgi:Flp pilus assembly protein TadD